VRALWYVRARNVDVTGMPPRPSLTAPSLALALLAAGCGSAPASSIVKTPEWKPEGQTKCAIGKSQRRPLIVEWPSPDRGALEAQAKKGIVAVRYVGCEMEVLRQCKAPGAYAYVPVTRKTDQLSIKTADELYASIPVHAAQFEGKLKESGELAVNMTIVGSFEADRTEVRADELAGNCGAATHYVSAITAGAFEFSAGGGAKVTGGVGVGPLGAGASSNAEREILNRDGFKGACEKATGSDKAPPDGCGALLRVEVVPLGSSASASPAVGRPPPTPEPPSAGPVASDGVVLSVGPPRYDPAPPPSTARTVGNIGIASGSLGLTLGLITGFVALLIKPGLRSDCPNNVCPPSKAGALTTYNVMGMMANVGFIGGGALLVGGIIARAVAPTAPKKAGITFDGNGFSGSF
jgi:hypothetical protein